MPPVSIANPILNSPYRMRGRHFRFDAARITSEVVGSIRQALHVMNTL
jgi:hypothetical protein